jgi:hypothetical protein
VWTYGHYEIGMSIGKPECQRRIGEREKKNSQPQATRGKKIGKTWLDLIKH